MDEASVTGFARLAEWLIPRRNKAHVVVFLVSILMIPGALTALEPIDMEAYEMESPELTAQEVIDTEFETTEIILGFAVSLRNPSFIGSTPVPTPFTSDGTPDWSAFPSTSEIAPAGEEWGGVESPSGGILNLTVLRELAVKHQVIYDHPLASYMKPLVNDVTGLQTPGVMSLVDIFRGFMNNSSVLTAPRMTLNGLEPALADWSDCGSLSCLTFDDENLTQAHIDLAANRMALADGAAFLRWTSLDRGFVIDSASNVLGPAGGVLAENGTWDGATWRGGRWAASASWLLVQLDHAQLKADGFTIFWKDSHPEKDIRFADDGFLVGGYRLLDSQLILHPPNYSAEECPSDDGLPCSVEWAYMDMEGRLRSTDNTVVTLLVGQAINVEVNREMQSSFGLVILMGLAVIVLLYLSLRRWSDVVIVGIALGGALLWMQGMIGHTSSLFNILGWDLLARSQFSNLLPILVLALGIDDSLHALHRYKEERSSGKEPQAAAQMTLHRVGRAILLTTLTTIAAFSANLFSDVAALRSFGLEAALGLLAAFLLTGMWVPLVRLSVDEWLEKRGKAYVEGEKPHLISPDKLKRIALSSGSAPNSLKIAFIAALLTIPAAWAMVNLEGDFAVEDFLEEDSDMVYGIDLITERFSDEGEPALLLLEGDVADPRVYAAIAELRHNMDVMTPGVPDKITRQPDGKTDLFAMDEMIDLAVASMIEDKSPFEAAGWNESSCEKVGIMSLPNLSDRNCLLFLYGFLAVYGVPGSASVPAIPAGLVGLFINPDTAIDSTKPWLDIEGNNGKWSRMLLRFGITGSDDFSTMGPGLEKLKLDLAPLNNLSSGTWDEPGVVSNEQTPLTWVVATGKPVTRYIASNAMQNEMQSSMILGSLFVFITLSIGFKSPKQAIIALIPILLVVVWLYGLIWLFGYSLNIVTVTIATISLGVGIDYCIHVTERYREVREEGGDHQTALLGVGGACALALVGSAASDVAGFAIIAFSPMGLFSSFGIFSAAMIALSLIASLILTTAALGLLQPKANPLPVDS